MISVVESVWNLPSALLDYNLATLTRQTQPPQEIIIVNACSNGETFADIKAVCSKYKVRMIDAPYPSFNLSRNLNVGIKAAEGEYVMLTAVDQLFSPNLMERVYFKLGRDRVVESTRGDLPVGFDLGNADTIIDRWPDIIARAIPPKKFSPGTIICTTRQWLFDVHGLDETRCPYNYCDSDLLSRSQMAGLQQAEIFWGESHILHMAHPRNIPLYYMKSSMPDNSLPIVRNSNGWGV